MAIQRLCLLDIETAILEATHYNSSANAPWALSCNLYKRINEYGQRLPMRLNEIAAQIGMQVPIHFDYLKTTANSSTSGTTVPVVSAGSSTIYMPTDYDHYMSFYDITNKRPIHVIENVDKWHYEELIKVPTGPPQYIEIMGFTTDGSSNWRRSGTLYPATVSGVTPSIRLHYWRLPAIMAGTGPATEYPDIDPKYESLFIYGPVCELTRSIDPDTYAAYSMLEKELLTQMVMTSRSL